MKTRLGIIGLGNQVRNYYLPYLERRARDFEDAVEIAWISGYLPDDEILGEPYKARGLLCLSADSWKELLRAGDLDAVLVSLPNALHEEPIRLALSLGISVGVDKPTTIGARDCRELVKLAAAKRLVFTTLSQRRYETVYKTVAEMVGSDLLGKPLLIDYIIAHENFGRGTWVSSRRLAGGGALISSGYHGIDVILWILSHSADPVAIRSVSARWILDDGDCVSEDDRVETVCAVRIILSDGLFNATASFGNPAGSLDENIKIFGSHGTFRIMRDRLRKTDQSAASLTYQSIDGLYRVFDTSGLVGERWAPLADFLDAVLARKQGLPWSVLSPASDSIRTIEVVEKAYDSARCGGREIDL